MSDQTNKKDDGGPAMMSMKDNGFGYYHPVNSNLTVRDAFAIAALTMPELVGDGKLTDAAAEVGMSPEEYAANGYQGYRALAAKRAYMMADAMIAERNKKP